MSTALTTLYHPVSIIDDWPWRGCRFDGVKVWWLMLHRDAPLGDYHQLIADYVDPPTRADWAAGADLRQDWHPEGRYVDTGLLDELFTKEEADQLARYLKDEHDTDVTLKPVTLPVPSIADNGNEYMSFSATPFGGPIDLYMLSREEDYALPFEVGGYYNIEDLTPVRVLTCAHECPHHAGVDQYVDYADRPTDPTSYSRMFVPDGQEHYCGHECSHHPKIEAAS